MALHIYIFAAACIAYLGLGWSAVGISNALVCFRLVRKGRSPDVLLQVVQEQTNEIASEIARDHWLLQHSYLFALLTWPLWIVYAHEKVYEACEKRTRPWVENFAPKLAKSEISEEAAWAKTSVEISDLGPEPELSRAGQLRQKARIAWCVLLIFTTQGPPVFYNRLGWLLFGPDWSSGCPWCGGTGRSQVLGTVNFDEKTGKTVQVQGPHEVACSSCNGFHC